MKIRLLFTKELAQDKVLLQLGANFECSFLKVLKITPIKPQTGIGDCRHFIITSANAFKTIKNLTFPKDSKFYIVGDKSEAALQKMGFQPELKAKNAKELSAEIIAKVAPTKIMHFCSSKALNTLKDQLTVADFDFVSNVVYKTEPIYPVYKENVDAIAFFSPSGVESFLKNNGLGDEKLFTIGKTTQKALQQFTDQPIIKSDKENLEGLLEKIKQTYEP